MCSLFSNNIIFSERYEKSIDFNIVTNHLFVSFYFFNPYFTITVPLIKIKKVYTYIYICDTLTVFITIHDKINFIV